MRNKKISNSFFFIVTNILMILIGVVLNYLIPIKATVDDYGMYRLFILYLPYFSLLHLGLIDGVYLGYKGKNLIENRKKVAAIFNALFLIRLVTSTFFIIIISVIVNDNLFKFILIAAIINSLLLNLGSYFNFLAQSTNNFQLSNKILLITKISFLVMFAVIFLTDIVSLESLILINIFSSAITVFFIITRSKGFINIKIKIDWQEVLGLLNKGFFLMLSNVIISFILSIDKIIASKYLNEEEFGYYVFAGTIMIVVYQLATSFGSILFAYATNRLLESKKHVNKIELLIILLVALSLNFFYLNELIISAYLPSYEASIIYLNMLIPAIFLLVIIQVIHSTIYKIEGKTYLYTKVTMFVALFELFVLLIVLNKFQNVYLVIILFNVVIVLWYLINILIFRMNSLKNNFKNYNIVILFIIILTFETTYHLDFYLKLSIYNSIITFLLLFFYFKNKKIILNIFGR